jgi:hypothetical protein
MGCGLVCIGTAQHGKRMKHISVGRLAPFQFFMFRFLFSSKHRKAPVIRVLFSI